MEINQTQADYIIGIYAEGGYDSEIESYLMLEGYPIGYFAAEYESNPKFKLLIDAGRIHARAYWERLLRLNVGNKGFNVPAWVVAAKGQGMVQYEDKKVSPITLNDNRTLITAPVQDFIAQIAAANPTVPVLQVAARVVTEDDISS